jgi:hypothetical protein
MAWWIVCWSPMLSPRSTDGSNAVHPRRSACQRNNNPPPTASPSHTRAPITTSGPRAYPANTGPPLVELGEADRQVIRRAIRQGTPVPPELRVLAGRYAWRVVRRHRITRWVAGAYGVLETAGSAIGSGWSRWSGLAVGVVVLGAVGYSSWFRHRAKRFARRA